MSLIVGVHGRFDSSIYWLFVRNKNNNNMHPYIADSQIQMRSEKRKKEMRKIVVRDN